MKLSTKHFLFLSAVVLASQSLPVAGEVVATSDIETNGEVTTEAVQGDATGTIPPECGKDDESCKAPVDEEPIVSAKEEEMVVEDPKCPSRPHVVRCAAKYLDTDQNGALEREELDSAVKNVSWIVRGLLKVIGSTDAIMKKCDADGDGKITIEHDMEATKETCLATCFKRKAFKQLFFPECTQ
jgi:hypothetical protein